jgi:predicted RND superfamily exporter protein
METTIVFLVIIIIGLLLHKIATKKDYEKLYSEYSELRKEYFELCDELRLQKNLAKIFEAGYDSLKEQSKN